MAMSLLSASLVGGNAISFFVTGYFFTNVESTEEIKDAMHKVLLTQTGFVLFGFTFF